jgi:tetratricopeptide (TPR) repeat protein
MVMLAHAYLLLGQNDLAIKLADQAYAERKEIDVKVPVSLLYLELGRVDQAVSFARELDKQLESEPRSYAKLIEGEVSRIRGDIGNAVSLFHEAKDLRDTWIGRFLLGRAYIEAKDWTAAYSEFELCLKRRGEAASVYYNDHPSFHYFPQVHYYLGRALEGLGSSAAADAYKEFLKIKEKSDGSDPMVEDTRRRLSLL